ncbi:MAG: TIGR03016 family PEP-CTERM system-associated outer membrane protein [Candidatus Thiodiazotropha sp. (ex Ctena orbiculata)]|nr:TIGR03016 family PEP-CTERM system-associated outer membrane protein [Candidatus Thiodiazotropha taylori]
MSCVKKHWHERKQAIRMLGMFSILSLPLAAQSGEWIVSPSITLDEIYTDNALLTNDDKESEYVTRVKPGISILREGARTNLDFNYSPEYRYYKEETRDNETVHQLRANADAELMENHLYLDLWATADQTRIANSRNSPDGLTGPTENLDYYTMGASPYYTTRFGNTSVLEARYSTDKVDYEEDTEVDSTSQKYNLILGSGTYSTAQAWELSASHTREDFSGTAEDNKISIFRGEFLQQITRRWAVAFAAGYEDYDLVIGEDVDGEIWSVGLVFTPTSRTRFAIGGGERAFGDDYYVDFEHEASRSVWRATYKRDYISARDEATHTSLFQRQDAFGNVVRDAVLDNPPPVRVTGVSTLSAEYYEVDRVDVSYLFSAQRTRFEVRGGYIKRDYVVDTQDTEDSTAAISFSRLISRKITGVARVLWSDHEQELSNYDEWTASLGLGYLLGQDARVSVGYSHLERDGDTELNTYEENRVNIGFMASF